MDFFSEDCIFELPLEIKKYAKENVLSKNREIYLNVPPKNIPESNFDYCLALKEGKNSLGIYRPNSIKLDKEKNTLYVTYSLFSFVENSHVPRELIKIFSEMQNYLANKNKITIHHFAPVVTKSKKKKGLSNLLLEIGYEEINAKENFYGKSYFPKK